MKRQLGVDEGGIAMGKKDDRAPTRRRRPVPRKIWQEGVSKATVAFIASAVSAGGVTGSLNKAQADVIFTVGDEDNFGGWPGNFEPFDNRDAGELVATNGAQFTDRSLMLSGQFPILFIFRGLPDEIQSARVEIHAAGLDNTNSYGVSLVSDNLETSVIGTMPTTGSFFGQTSFSGDVPSTALHLITAVSAAIAITPASNDSFAAFDFARLVVSPIPEPGTFTLCLTGLASITAGLLVSRRYSSRGC